MDQQDFRDVFKAGDIEVPGEASNVPDAGIPQLQSIIATPDDLKLPTPLITVSVNQTVPLRDLLFEMAEQAGVDLELDPQIRGSIIFTARERPFDEVVGRISEMAGLRYTYKNNVLRMELDRPYSKTYKIDYVNILRSIKSNVNVDVSVVSGGEASVGSAATIESSLEGDFWKELETNLEQILVAGDTHVTLATLADPVAMPSSGMVAPMGNDPSMPPPANAGPVINVSAQAADPLVPNAPATFSVNRQAGMINIFASDRQQREIRKYLEEVRRNVTSQVLIEAKVLEVTLTDEFAAGINWNMVDGNLQNIDIKGFNSDAVRAGFKIGFDMPAFSEPASGLFSATVKLGSEEAILDALSRFGTVRALSNPRLTVLNNQPAILNVVENRVFFELDVDIETDSNNGNKTVTVDSQIRSVPEGIMISVVPAVNVDTREISMIVRPTVTSVVREVADPGVSVALLSSGVSPGSLGNIESLIPQLSVQEIDSLLRMQSGQAVIMGGLMRDRNNVTDTGVPVLSSVPFLGNLFKSHQDRVVKSELVVFLKATLMTGSNIEQPDRELYRRFSQDRRPMKM